MEKYEQPGVSINSKPPSKEYKDNYDSIFGKKESWLDRRDRKDKEFNEKYRKITDEFLKPLTDEMQELVDKYNIELNDTKAEMQEKVKHDNCTD